MLLRQSAARISWHWPVAGGPLAIHWRFAGAKSCKNNKYNKDGLLLIFTFIKLTTYL